MKKTIQINIAGMVFNIEEDAYEKLNNYLTSIKQYFASYEGSQEIVSDIEARIAEKFWTNQKSDSQPVITLEGVNDLIKSMGSVADFEAIEEDEDLQQSAVGGRQAAVANSQSPTGDTQQAPSATTEPKRLYRDVKRKALGGVLAGLAHYFNIDVVWIRIIFLFLALGLPPIDDSLGPFSGFMFLAYFVCWIVFPQNFNLDEDKKIKKFYRNNDEKVLGGVCSGLAAYFGVDITVVRLLFAFGLFVFGIGFISYIILWIVAPKAQTLTQKMEMKGEPVTLSNIESNIKESINVDKNAPENGLTKILLFPFRLVGAVIKGLGEVLKTLGPVARVIAGIFLVIISLAVLIGFIVSIAAFYGVTSGIDGVTFFDNSPFHNLIREVHPTAGLFAFFALVTPFLAFLLAGLTFVSNRRIGTRNFWISLLGLWLIGIIGISILGIKGGLNFAKKERFEQTKNFPYTLSGQTLMLDSKDNRDEVMVGISVKNEVKIDLVGYEGTDLKLEQRFEASGRTRIIAENNAKKILYNITQRDSTLVFDEEVSLPEKTPYRGQELEMTLSIPYERPFKISQDFYYHVFGRNRNEHNNFDIDGDDIDKYTFVMKRDSGIVCRDCPKLSEEEKEAIRNSDSNDEDASFDYSIFDEKGPLEKKFNLKGFEKVDAGGTFVVTIRRGDSFSITADSDNQDELDDLDLEISNNTLKISYKDKFLFGRRNESVRINITMPKLTGLDMSGSSSVKAIGFKDKTKDLEIDLSGSAKAAIDVEVRKLEFDASGASRADLRGSADKINIDISGACHIDAKQMEINQVQADASGDSHIKFGKVKDFNSNTSGASRVSRE